LETHYILSIWLKDVPEYVVLFTRLVIINALIDSLSYPLQTFVQATGNIKHYQSIVGGAMLLNLPISYLFLCLGFLPEVTMYTSIILAVVCLFLRLLLLKKLVNFPINDYFKNVVAVVITVSLVSLLTPLFIIYKMDDNYVRLFVVGLSSFSSVFLVIYHFGLSIEEKLFFSKVIKNKLGNKLKL
jgi:hypothetical protein